MPAIAWTYATLSTALQQWPIEDGATFLANMPNIIGLGERRLWGDLNIESYDKVDEVNFQTVIGTRITPKPSDTMQLRNVGYFDGTMNYKALEKRTQDYCKMFAPLTSAKAPPQFYAELSSTQILVVPSPDAAYQLSFHYIATAPTESLQPTAPTLPTWLATIAPDALLAACLAEAEHYIQADDRYTDYINKYNNELLPRLRAELRGTIRADYAPFKAAATPAQ